MTDAPKVEDKKAEDKKKSPWWLPIIVTTGPPPASAWITVHITVAVARSPSRDTRGLEMMWNDRPTRPSIAAPIVAAISSRPVARPTGPRDSSPSGVNSAA